MLHVASCATRWQWRFNKDFRDAKQPVSQPDSQYAARRRSNARVMLVLFVYRSRARYSLGITGGHMKTVRMFACSRNVHSRLMRMKLYTLQRTTFYATRRSGYANRRMD